MATPAIGGGGLGPLVLAALAARNSGGGPGGPPGGAPNPMAALGIPGAPPGATGSAGPMPGPGPMPGQDDQGQQYAQEYASLKGADPGMLVREIKQMQQQVAVLMVQNLERLPNVSGQLSRLIPLFDRVLKELQQATNVQSSVRPPLGLGSAMPPPDSPNAGGPPPGGGPGSLPVM